MTDKKTSIQLDADGNLQVPSRPIIPFIEGDGTGPDIWRATRAVLDAAVIKSYDGQRRIDWLEILAGEKAFKTTGEWLPQDTVDQIRQYHVAIKGPLTTPVGRGIRSVNVALRQILDLYACIRPVKYLTGTPSPMLQPADVDMIVFRENTEDVYTGIEWEAGSPVAEKVIDLVATETGRRIRPDSGIGIKPMSRNGTRRLVIKAIEYAIENKKKCHSGPHGEHLEVYRRRLSKLGLQSCQRTLCRPGDHRKGAVEQT